MLGWVDGSHVARASNNMWRSLKFIPLALRRRRSFWIWEQYGQVWVFREIVLAAEARIKAQGKSDEIMGLCSSIVLLSTGKKRTISKTKFMGFKCKLDGRYKEMSLAFRLRQMWVWILTFTFTKGPKANQLGEKFRLLEDAYSINIFKYQKHKSEW